MFAFASPLWLLLIPAWLSCLLIIWWRQRRLVDGNAGLTLAHPRLATLLADDPLPGRSNAPFWLNTLAMVLLIGALARPQWVGEWIPEPPEGRDVMLLVDASQTMSIRDFDLQGKAVSRMTVLKSIVSRFVEAREGDRLGVIAFGSEAATLAPPSFDRQLINGVLERLQVGMAGDNTAIGDAIGLALKQVQQEARLRPALILFTDGDSTAGDVSPQEAVELARRMRVAIYTVQIGGTLSGRSVTNVQNAAPGLRDIARLTGGRYYQAGNTDALHDVVRDIGALEKTVARPLSRRAIQEWYPWLLAVAAGLLTLARLIEIRRTGS